MDERVIHLEDGSTVSAKVNFATIYYIQKFKLDKLMEKKKTTQDDEMELAARILHVVLLSNERNYTFEEALYLIPLDTDEIEEVMNDFKEKLEKLKKKKESKTKRRTLTEQ